MSFGIVACSAAPEATPPNDTRPMRIVSLDYCADQYVLKFADRAQILALSPDAAKPFSYMREVAIGLSTVKPLAENVLILQPDLVVRSYGGGPGATAFFETAHVPVLNVGYAATLDDIKRVTRDMAAGLGAPEKGEAVVADIEARLAVLPDRLSESALYMTPGGVTSGPGSLVDEMMRTAGLSNFEATPGWRDIPLERLAYAQPDVIAAAFFDTESQQKHSWSAMRHPIAKAQLTEVPTVPLDGAWLGCGAWYMVDAVEALANREARP